MLLFIEREQFLKLFKFGEIKIPATRFVDGYDPANGKSDIPVEILDSRLPLFEQDHEVLILEIPKDVIILGVEISVKISHVRKIFPLSEEADRFLTGRMNPSIIFQLPIFEKLINEVKILRDFRYRQKAWEALAVIFQVDREIVNDFTEEITDGLKNRLGYSNKAKRRNYLFSLICFNRNPIYPQGYIEYLYKAASVFVEMKNGSESDFERGPLYSFLESKSDEFKKLSMNECILRFKSCLESKNFVEELSKNYTKIDVLIIGVWFLFIKDKLNRNNNNLLLVREEILQLKSAYPKETAIILYMVGMLFGFDNLYSSLYDLNTIPIYNAYPGPGIAEQNKDLKKKIAEERQKSDQLKFDLDRCLKEIDDLHAHINILKQAASETQEQMTLLIDSIRERDFTRLESIQLKFNELTNMSADSKAIDNNTDKKILSHSEVDKNIPLKEPNPNSMEALESETEMKVFPSLNIENIGSENYFDTDINVDILEVKESEYFAPGVVAEDIISDELGKSDVIPSFIQSEFKEPDVISDVENTKPDNHQIMTGQLDEGNGQPKVKKAKEKSVKTKQKVKEPITPKPATQKVPDTLFDQYPEKNVDDSKYLHDELLFIIHKVKEKGVLTNPTELQTFEEAIMGYSPNGGPQHAILNEIEELQKDLKLSNEIADQLRAIILEIKK